MDKTTNTLSELGNTLGKEFKFIYQGLKFLGCNIMNKKIYLLEKNLVQEMGIHLAFIKIILLFLEEIDI